MVRPRKSCSAFVLHDGHEAVAEGTLGDCPVGPLCGIRPAATESRHAGSEVQGCRRAGHPTFPGAGAGGNALPNLDTRPERAHELLQSGLELPPILRRPYPRHAVDGEAIPIETRGGVARVEIPDDAGPVGRRRRRYRSIVGLGPTPARPTQSPPQSPGLLLLAYQGLVSREILRPAFALRASARLRRTRPRGSPRAPEPRAREPANRELQRIPLPVLPRQELIRRFVVRDAHVGAVVVQPGLGAQRGDAEQHDLGQVGAVLEA